ncbi:MAG TPA: PilZ domain-containing protein [Steroidobacteraceae bacterium]|jgi:hypothetical protein|nr:PilZ domain-containing protein [Steroidobacteraceae bacterium]
MEHRWGRRIALDLPVRLVLSPGVVVWGQVRNVSMTGAFVRSTQPLPVGALVSIEPTAGSAHCLPAALDATVVWTRDGGAGFEWCEPMDSAPWARLDSTPAWDPKLSSPATAAQLDIRRA